MPSSSQLTEYEIRTRELSLNAFTFVGVRSELLNSVDNFDLIERVQQMGFVAQD